MVYTSSNGSFDFNEHYEITSIKGKSLPGQQYTEEYVIGRDGPFTFLNGFSSKIITIDFVMRNSDNLVGRRTLNDTMNKILSLPGVVVFDFDNIKSFEASVVGGSDIDYSCVYDTMSLSFKLSPIGLGVLNKDNFTWGNAAVKWGLVTNTWGDKFQYELSSPGTIEVNNAGNKISEPIIRLSGSGDVTLTLGDNSFTFTDLEDSIYIDNRMFNVYNTSLENKRGDFSGDYLNLAIGSNEIEVSGTFSNLEIEFINKDFYI